MSVLSEEKNLEDNGDVSSPEDDCPAVAVDWKNLLKPDYSGSIDVARKRVFALSASRNKSTYRKVEEAVSMIGTGDAGASIPAILTWIINNYPILDPSKLKVNVKRAVLKGLKGGRLVRTKNSKKAQGVTGSFTFPAQRIKLKAVRLEGKKYVFPILQPVSSNASSATLVVEDGPLEAAKKSESVVDGGRTSSTPKRRLSSTPKRLSSTPKRLPKSKKDLNVVLPDLNATV